MQTVKELVSELTDVDSRLLRTLATLIVKPQKIIEARLANDDRYTSPLKLWTFTASAYIVLQALFNLFVDDESPSWWLPEKISSRSDTYTGLFQALFPALVLFVVIPVVLVLLKLLYLRKTWRELIAVTLCVFSIFWIVMIIFAPLNYYASADFIVPSFAFLIVALSFRRAIAGKFFPSILKWTLISICSLAMFFYVASPAVYRIYEKLMLSFVERTDPGIRPSSSDTIEISDASIESVHPIRNDRDNVMTNTDEDGGLKVECISSKNKVLWTTQLPKATFFRKAARISPTNSEPLYVILTNSAPGDASTAFVLSSNGNILYSRFYNEKLVLNGACLLNNDLIISGGRPKNNVIVPFIDVITFDLKDDRFQVEESITHYISKDNERFGPVDIMEDSVGSPMLIALKYLSGSRFALTDQNEIIEVTLVGFSIDSTLLVQWELPLFKKTNRYSPRIDETFNVITDHHNKRALATYTLANDSTNPTHLFSISTDGKKQWMRSISSNNITMVTDLYSGDSGIYYCGSTTSGLENIVGNINQQGLFGYLAADGSNATQRVYGSAVAGSIQMGTKIITGDSIRIFNFSLTNNPLALGATWEILSFNKSLP